MKTIWKYDINLDDEVIVEMPAGAELLYVGSQNPVLIDLVQLWCRVDPDAAMANRRLLMRGTGHPVGSEPYVGTVIVANGALVWHVFDGGWV